MTMQKRDAMRYEGEGWAVWGINGEGFFEPEKFGLQVTGGNSTACWRGYYGTYHVPESYLQLLELEINLNDSPAPPLNDRLPTRNSEEDFSTCGDLVYRDVGLPIPFTGGLLLCRKWVKPLPSGIGPELAWMFEQIRELIFEQGRLVQAYDHSAAVAQVRQEVAANNREIAITVPVREDMGERIVRCKRLELRIDLNDRYARYESLKARINACFKFEY